MHIFSERVRKFGVASGRDCAPPCMAQSEVMNEDCFYYYSERKNVVVLFGTLKVQSFILTEVSDCGPVCG